MIKQFSRTIIATTNHDTQLSAKKFTFFDKKQIPKDQKFLLRHICFMCEENPTILDLECFVDLEIGSLLYGRYYGFNARAFNYIADYPIMLTANSHFTITVNMIRDNFKVCEVTCILSGALERNVV